jgi:hypothetical protein
MSVPTEKDLIGKWTHLKNGEIYEIEPAKYKKCLVVKNESADCRFYDLHVKEFIESIAKGELQKL